MSLTALTAALVGTLPAANAANVPVARAQDGAEGCPPVPANQNPADPTFYDFVSTYRSACADRRNWDRSFADATVSTVVDGRVRLSVTASSALAGAVASLKVGGKEYIASGGHGAAMQYAFHAWHAGTQATECYNPTQAGSRLDDVGHEPPFHGPSTSALYRLTGTGATIRTAARPAMYMERTDPTLGWNSCRAADHQPDRLPYSAGLSPYWLSTEVRLAPDHGLAGLENVIKLAAVLDSEDDLHEHFNAVLVAYLQRDFTATYTYDPATRTLREFSGDLATLLPSIRCTADGAYCLGMYFPAADLPGAYYYTMTRAPFAYNAYLGEHTVQMTAPTSRVGAGGTTRLRYDTYLVVGDLARAADTLAEVHRQVGGPGTT
ncbi:hypothetical protein [Micromonospora sp. CPCC 206061]|uniref:hypothetical protein n=1 Tax=Micromonospora sp. CPCC 206061 TaxID=3122410 RepID=UPI002FF32FC3